MHWIHTHTDMDNHCTTASSRRDARMGEQLLRQLRSTVKHTEDGGGDACDTDNLSTMDPVCITTAWERVIATRCNHRMRVRALRQIKPPLAGRGRVGAKIINSLPHRIPCTHRRTRPDPLMRQRRIIEEDAVPARITTPWIREMLLHILHHPNRGVVSIKKNSSSVPKPTHGERPPRPINVCAWHTTFCDAWDC